MEMEKINDCVHRTLFDSKTHTVDRFDAAKRDGKVLDI